MIKTNTNNTYNCAVVGDWHLAFVTAGVLSYMGYKTILVNHKSESKWKEFPELPVYEPGLKEIFESSRQKGLLDYTNDVTKDWSADFVWMAIDTPVNDRDEADTTPLIQVAKKVKENHPNIKAFITNSQIPIGFCRMIEKEFGLPIVYIPENLRLGKGIETLYKADRTVIGARQEALANEVKNFLAGFQTEFVLCNLETSEMVKHANNAFLATSISFANELARLGEVYGVDGQLVAKALKLDKRIGPGAYVAPGLGFAGGTLPRDVRIMQKLGKELKIPMRMMDAVMDVNEDTTQAICESVERYLKEINSKNILILGYTYKADTDTLRRSLSLDIADLLVQKGYKIFGYDPVMNEKDLSLLKGKIEHLPDLYEANIQPGVVLLMTARPGFKVLDWKVLSEKWNVKANKNLVMDTQNFLDKEPVLANHLYYKRLWTPIAKPQLVS